MAVHAGSLAEMTEAAFRGGLLSATGKLRAFAWSLVGKREKADDLVQDTMLRALAKRDRFQPGTNLQAWLFTIMRNRFYSECRKRSREVEDVDGVYASKLVVPAEQHGRVDCADVGLALTQLPDDQREALLLIGAEGLIYEDAATICRTKVATVKSRVNRARKRLSELLGMKRPSTSS